MSESTIHPHDVGLSAKVIHKRKKNRYLAHWMLTVAVLTAVPGWILYGRAFSFALRIKEDSPILDLLAWLLLIISSVTLVLGLWYLLLAQVRRVARIVGEEETAADAGTLRCPNCGWPHDGPDRFCRHCGKPLGMTVVARPPG